MWLKRLLTLAATLLAACGQTERTSNAVTGAGAGAPGLGDAGAPNLGVAIDASACASLPASDCAGVEAHYDSNGSFDATPALAECSRFNSFDGCGVLEFAFDARGCVVAVSPGAAGWKASQHIQGLQDCLTAALGRAYWPCLASGSLRYEESCRIR